MLPEGVSSFDGYVDGNIVIVSPNNEPFLRLLSLTLRNALILVEKCSELFNSEYGFATDDVSLLADLQI